ncbi:hypothetical protein PTSG_03568 [Salpingoeca rosetta]|uniref:Sialidase-1 n=1 Tax=Salpingoeca rosetta (strain ATCC 50818 / BSB-021) TaxID=946362 RepID=F2U5Z4_SALR5|nr:uncharacterized protein PTSG_03568 [Salpingoeca rosetta]EGD82935.1 hypothetical protein PTSG_03568 [Salpingoeca rosetta]|eukprot:XP_004995299.1 hypothetical protein PTSG_03568 [Salpingoeca rosetta]
MATLAQQALLLLAVAAVAVVVDVTATTTATAAATAAVTGVVRRASTVFRAGEASYSCFRVPTIATVDGAMLVFAEARRTSCADQSPKDIVYKRSHDNGTTWSELARLVGNHKGNHTYRNPYATVVSQPGSAACATKLVVGFVNSTLPEPWINQHRWSCNGGKTWSSIERVNLAPWEGVLAGPGTGIQLSTPPHAALATAPRSAGGVVPPSSAAVGDEPESKQQQPLHSLQRQQRAARILGCGATGYHAGHSMNAVVWYSDDGGVTFNVSSSVFAQMQECQVVQLWNGTLVLNMRNSHLNACRCRAYALSHDGGVTWEGPYWAPQLIEPVCSAGLIRLGGALYFSNPHSASHRVNMTVQVATSDDMRWHVYQQLWPGPAAYSVMGHTPASEPCIVYERGSSSPYEELAFAALAPAN